MREKSIAVDVTLVPTDGLVTRVDVVPVVTDLNGVVAKRFQPRVVDVSAEGETTVSFGEPWSDARLWCPEDPHLYRLRTRVRANGQLVDEHFQRFGFREFWIEGRDFFLNGNRITLLGDWVGVRPSGSDAFLRPALRQRILVEMMDDPDGEIYTRYLPALLECNVGKGRVMLCALNVTEGCERDDPEATILLRNLLQQMASPAAEPQPAVGFVGDAKELGFFADTLMADNVKHIREGVWADGLSAGDVLILAGGISAAGLNANRAVLTDFVRAGGTVLVAGAATEGDLTWVPLPCAPASCRHGRHRRPAIPAARFTCGRGLTKPSSTDWAICSASRLIAHATTSSETPFPA